MARAGAVNRLWLLTVVCISLVVGPAAAKDNVNKFDLFERPRHTVGQPSFASSGCVGACVIACGIYLGPGSPNDARGPLQDRTAGCGLQCLWPRPRLACTMSF
jgi:hypothetical protein